LRRVPHLRLRIAVAAIYLLLAVLAIVNDWPKAVLIGLVLAVSITAIAFALAERRKPSA
jgi:hypothetical protein